MENNNHVKKKVEKINILLIVNPVSGKQKAELFADKIEILFHDTEELRKYIVYRMTSNYSSAISHYIYDNIVFLQNCKCIYSIGGDGTFHLIKNALSQVDIEVPICIIPAGTGNGIYRSILYEDNYPDNQSSLNMYIKKIVKNPSVRLLDKMIITDLETIDKEGNKEGNKEEDDIVKKKQLEGIIGISWGIISDIDINTEWMRMLGSIRLHLGGIYYMLKKNRHYGKFMYRNDAGTMTTVEGDFIHFWANNSSYGSQFTFSSPFSKMNDGYIYISYIMAPISRCQLTSILLALDSGKYIEYPGVHYIRTKYFELEINGGLIVIDGELSKLRKISCNVQKGGVKIMT